MRRRIKLSIFAATAGILLLAPAIYPSAGAQGFGGGRGLNLGAQSMALGGGLTALRDPMRSAESALLQRDDVRHELMLDGRQQQQIDAQVTKGRQDVMDKGRTAVQ